MRIAIWNIERLKHKTDIVQLNLALAGLKADILVLTETDNQVDSTNYQFCIETPKLIEIRPSYYKESENRVTIYTNYEIIRQYETYDKYTSLKQNLNHSLFTVQSSEFSETEIKTSMPTYPNK